MPIGLRSNRNSHWFTSKPGRDQLKVLSAKLTDCMRQLSSCYTYHNRVEFSVCYSGGCQHAGVADDRHVSSVRRGQPHRAQAGRQKKETVDQEQVGQLEPQIQRGVCVVSTFLNTFSFILYNRQNVLK